MITFRKATNNDIDSIEKIYSDIHNCEENGETTTGWIRGVYPTRATAVTALSRDDLFILDDNGVIAGAAVINQTQCEEYKYGKWDNEAPREKVTVLHTLVISPKENGKGYGKSFVDFYEKYALQNESPYLRMDTNERNIKARAMYKKLGFKEVGTVTCDFNGIKDVKMILLEKYAGGKENAGNNK